MPANELVVVHSGHQIYVVKTPSGGARLYVDGELLDTTNDLYASEDEPILLGVFDENRVEAFVKPSENMQAAIRINGEWITHDKAYAVASD
jgi:hypothetical protein